MMKHKAWSIRGGLLPAVLLALCAPSWGQTNTVTRSVAYTYDATTGQVLTEQVDPGGTHCVQTTNSYDAYGNKSSVLVSFCGTDPAASFAPRMTVNQFAQQAAQAAFGNMPALPAAPAGAFLSQSQTGQPNGDNSGLAVVWSQSSGTYHPANGAALTQTANAYILNAQKTSSAANPAGDLTTKSEVDGLGRVWKSYSPTGRDGAGVLQYSTAEVRRVYCLGSMATSPVDSNCINFVKSGIPTQYWSGMLFNADGSTATSAEGRAVTAYYVETIPKDGNGNIIGGRSRVHYDSLNREIAKETETYSRQWSMTLTVFDRLGMAAASWSAYFGRDAVGTFVTPPDELQQWASVRDFLHRPLESSWYHRSAAGAVATVQKSVVTYQGLRTNSSVPSPDGVPRTSIGLKYGSGLVAQTIDANGGTLNNAYDPLGNLTQTKDALGNISTVSYTPGTARFKTGMKDPNQGQWTYAYNALGQLIKQTDGRGKVTTLSYDLLGRLVAKTSADLNSYWYYDTTAAGVACAGGIGRLCETYAGNPVNAAKVTGKVFTYDNMARAVQADVWLAGKVFTSKTGYDNLGRPEKLTYPTGFSVKYGYSPTGSATRLAGVLERVFDDTSAAVNARHFWRIDQIADPKTVFDAKGNLLKADVGHDTGAASGWISSNNSFDSISGRAFLLQAGTAANANANALNHAYTFDVAGNVVQRAENLMGVVESFQHDRLNRLTAHTVTSTSDASASRTVSVQYNAIGNILYKSDVGGYAYAFLNAGATAPHAVSSAGGTNYQYDTNGNLTSTSGVQVRTNTWNSFNQTAAMAYQGRSVAFQYDESYQRVEEVITNGSTVRTLHKFNPDNQGGLGFEREITRVAGAITRNENRHYIMVGGAVIGVVKTLTPVGNDPVSGPLNGTISTAAADANLVNYWHKDALGSIVAVTDRDGRVLERMAYDAWGRRMRPTGVADPYVDPVNGDRGFTGHEHLDELAYVHMNGRIYDPMLARFLSPDPVIGDPNDLQNFNRYSYVNNSPLRFTDPSGYCIWDYCIAEIAAVIVGYEMTQHGNEYWRMAGTLMMMWGGQGLIDKGMGVTGGSTLGGNAEALQAGASNVFNTGGIGNSMLAAASATAISGGSPEEVLSSAVFAGMFTGIGQMAAGPQQLMAHMLVGCMQGEMAGGKCGPSAMAAGFGKLVTYGLSDTTLDKYSLGIVTTIAGGTASVIGGGKFSNGAFQAGFGYIFNALTAKELRRKYDTGKGGHHYFPFENWPEDLSEAAKIVFGDSTTGPLKHFRTREHIEYGKAVREMFDSLGIDPAKVTSEQAKKFINSIKTSKTPAINGYLGSLRVTNKVVPKIRGFGVLAIGVGLLPFALDPSYTWRNYGEDSVCGLMGGCGDLR